MHISRNPNDCFAGAQIPCSAYVVEPKGTLVRIDDEKSKTDRLVVVEEVSDLDTLFGWSYSEAVNPFNPLQKKRAPTNIDIERLHVWISVWNNAQDSDWAGVGDRVWYSVWDSVWDSVWVSVWASVRDSVWASVWASVRASVWASVRASVWAYIGSFFPNIPIWRGLDGIDFGDGYPFQPAVDLWMRSLVPSYDGQVWRLHSGPKAEIVHEA